MKKLVLNIVLILISILAYSQAETIYKVEDIPALKLYYGNSTRLRVVVENRDYTQCSSCIVNDSTIYAGASGRKWQRMSTIDSSHDFVPGGPITSNDIIGFNPGTGITTSTFIQNVFYQSQAPIATLTGGLTLELRSSQTMNYTLNWSAGRLLATKTLQNIIVAGQTESFTQPSAPGTVSGTQDVSFPANTDITYSNVVTTTDSKSTTATTTFAFLPKRYYGWISTSDTAGIGTFGYDDSKITALNGELSPSKIKTWNTGNPTGTQIYVYAYYYTAGNLNNLILNGFNSLDAFNVIQRQFTNALGFTGQWIIYWNKNGQTLSSDVIAN